MKDKEAILDIVTEKASQLSTIAMLYRFSDERRSSHYRAQADALAEVRALIEGNEVAPDDWSSFDTFDPLTPWLNWTALVVQAFGGHTVRIYGTHAAGSDAYEALCREHESQLEDDMRCHLVSVDGNGLSPELHTSSEVRFAYALITEVGGDYECVCLYDSVEQAKASEAQFREDAAFNFEREDAYCTWLAVSLPRAKQVSGTSA